MKKIIWRILIVILLLASVVTVVMLVQRNQEFRMIDKSIGSTKIYMVGQNTLEPYTQKKLKSSLNTIALANINKVEGGSLLLLDGKAIQQVLDDKKYLQDMRQLLNEEVTIVLLANGEAATDMILVLTGEEVDKSVDVNAPLPNYYSMEVKYDSYLVGEYNLTSLKPTFRREAVVIYSCIKEKRRVNATFLHTTIQHYYID